MTHDDSIARLGSEALPGVRGGRQTRSPTDAASVLLVGFDPVSSGTLEELLADRADVLAASDPEAGLQLLGARNVAVLCLGEELSATRARRFLDAAWQLQPGADRRDVVLAAGPDLDLFQDLVDDDRLYYLTSSQPPLADVEPLLVSALPHRTSYAPRDPDRGDTEEWTLGARSVLELAGRLALEKREGRVAALAADEVSRLLEADAAECLLYDAADETLCRPTSAPSRSGEQEERESVAAGLLGFIARTQRAIVLDRIGSDPRYDPEADNPGESADERFLAVPVVDGERVLAVVVVRRSGSRPVFSSHHRQLTELLADQVAPILVRLGMQQRLESQGDEASPEIFRREALEYHAGGFGEPGQPLQISPQWTRWVFTLLMSIFLFAVLFSALGSIHEYASGPAVVRFLDRSDVTAKQMGIVAEVVVESGQRVAAGDLLMTFHNAQEAAELERIEKELELVLVQRLRDPADPTAARALSALRAQKQFAEARLKERSVRSPRAGSIGDLRLQPGQHVAPGQVLLSLSSDDSDLGIVVLLPGRYRPFLQPGMPLRLELQGRRHVYLQLTVETIGEEVIGPAEARRFLGAGIADAVSVSGPVVMVHARLPVASFASGGRRSRIHDGSQGTAEVRVRSERIIQVLIPGLESLYGRFDG